LPGGKANDHKAGKR